MRWNRSSSEAFSRSPRLLRTSIKWRPRKSERFNSAATVVFPSAATPSAQVRTRECVPIRVLRRRSPTHSVRQHDAGGGTDPGRRPEAEDARLFRVAELLPVRGEVWAPGRGQRQGQDREPGRLCTAQLHGPDSARSKLGRAQHAACRRLPSATGAADAWKIWGFQLTMTTCYNRSRRRARLTLFRDRPRRTEWALRGFRL